MPLGFYDYKWEEAIISKVIKILKDVYLNTEPLFEARSSLFTKLMIDWN